MRMRDHMTDFYFAYNLPYDLFETISCANVDRTRRAPEDLSISFNPELAPKNMLFEQAQAIEKMPPEERAKAAEPACGRSKSC
jgi:hypothetical protein